MAQAAYELGIPPYLGKYRLDAKLGAGYSGSIWRATHVHTGQVIALKVQDEDHECPTNRYERCFYPLIQNGIGMPKLWDSGLEEGWDWLAMELLGPSLDSLFRQSGKPTFDLRTVLCVAQQIIARLEYMHIQGVLHRDIQLGNCTLGLGRNSTTLYMIDFGFSKRYIDPHTHRHIPDSNKRRDFIGNYWFSSVAVHCRGRVPSRRDDLEAAALMLIHMLTPRGLPWTRNGIPKTEEDHDRLKYEKQWARPEDLCRGLPSEFEEFLRYCRRLRFMDTPDYGRWIDEFQGLAEELGFGDDDAVIWPPPPTTKPAPVNAPRRSEGPPPDEMDQILQGLGGLNLVERPVLGDRQNLDFAVNRARNDVPQGKQEKPANPVVIDLSDTTAQRSSTTESRGSQPPLQQNQKAFRLSRLSSRVSMAADNQTLSLLVEEFIAVLQMNSSRTLTKEGFAFLDVLYKQLADPSVFVVPMRQPRSRTEKEQETVKESGNGRLGVVAGLRREVRTAISNKALASMLADFGRITNKSSGRTVTKDGFAFLQGVADRLKAL